MTSTSHHARCLAFATCGVLLGASVNAWAQAVPPVVPVDLGLPAWLVSLLQIGGLPAVVGALAFVLGRGGLSITVRLSDDDRTLLRSLQPPAKG